MCAGQNSQISEEYARTVGRLPPVIDRPTVFSPPDEGSIPDREHSGFSEKSLEHTPEGEKPRSNEEILVLGNKEGHVVER